ncbi:AAA family ATPase [Terrabacter terrae]|uniref:AAA family ATPase n=1 Tax=Terrabacter terrae TaxID=318434 RepID=A0ABN2UK39_9MICO
MVANVNAEESVADDHFTAPPQGAVEEAVDGQSFPVDLPEASARPEGSQQAAPAPARYLTADELQWADETVGAISSAYASKVVGQSRLQETLLIALLTGGHVLLESVPGLAKTTAAQTIAQAVGGRFHRIQCTPDLLPSDIVGTQVYNQHLGTFETQLGPVHANFVLLDEINRSSAKTQSAMLEAMQERQTSIGDRSYALPDPFLVLATQNPIEQEGTYPLPEAQMDRFMLKDVLDYPSPAEEAEVLRRIDSGIFVGDAEPVVSLDEVKRLQGLVQRVYVDPAIINYIVGIGYVTRHPRDYIEPSLAAYVGFGASPRASIAFASAARARALVDGRNHVVPDDVKALTHRVLRHRVTLGFEAVADDVAVETVIDAMVGGIRTP